MEETNNEITRYSEETTITKAEPNVLQIPTGINVTTEEMQEFLNCDEIGKITKKGMNEEEGFENSIRIVCKQHPFDVLNLAGYETIKKKYIDYIAQGIDDLLDVESGLFIKKKNSDDEKFKKELENARTELSVLADFRQSAEIDKLCMDVLKNPYHKSEAELKNWLDLMLTNASERIFVNITDIIGRIENETNIFEKFKENYKEAQEYDKKKKVKDESGRILSELKKKLHIFVESGETTVEQFCNSRRKEYIDTVLRSLPTFYNQIKRPDSKFKSDPITLNCLQTLLDTISQAKYKYISTLKDKKEELIQKIALYTHIDLTTGEGKRAYTTMFDIVIKHLKENVSIKKFIDELFSYGDIDLIIEKGSIVLGKKPNGETYPKDLITPVVSHFIELSRRDTEHTIKENDKERIKGKLADFILDSDDDDIKKEKFDDIIDKYSNDDKVDFISLLMNSQNFETLYSLINLHKFILSSEMFTKEQRLISFKVLINNYQKMTEYDKELTENILLGIICGEEKYKTCKDIQQDKAEEICNLNKTFINDIARRCKGNRELYRTLPEHILTKFLESDEVDDDEKMRILRILIDKAKSENASNNYKKEIRDYIIGYCNEGDWTKIPTFLNELLNDYFGIGNS